MRETEAKRNETGWGEQVVRMRRSFIGEKTAPHPQRSASSEEEQGRERALKEVNKKKGRRKPEKN